MIATGDSAEVSKALKAVKSVQIRSFRFDTDFACSRADLGALRSQLSQPGWSRLVQVHNRNQEDVDVYVALEDQVIRGIAIVACQPVNSRSSTSSARLTSISWRGCGARSPRDPRASCERR